MAHTYLTQNDIYNLGIDVPKYFAVIHSLPEIPSGFFSSITKKSTIYGMCSSFMLHLLSI